MPFTIEYWTKAWDEAQSDIDDGYGGIYKGKKAYPGKVLNLLSKYAAYSKSLMKFGCHKNLVGGMFHFFWKGRDDQYTTQVVDAIHNFYHVSGSHALCPKYHSVKFILSRVKHEMGDIPLDRNDNLAKILEVIRIKTGVNYEDLILDDNDTSNNLTEI